MDSDFNLPNEEEAVEKDKLNHLYILLAIVILIWLGSILVLQEFYPVLEERSLYGSSFNTISSLFSGLAFAGIIYTILLQRKELQLQRKELRETRKVLAKTAIAQEASARQFERQSNNMKMTARLNALNTLIVDANRKIDALVKHADTKSVERRMEIITERDNYIKEIKRILNLKM